jgi:hypothetical protein
MLYRFVANEHQIILYSLGVLMHYLGLFKYLADMHSQMQHINYW